MNFSKKNYTQKNSIKNKILKTTLLIAIMVMAPFISNAQDMFRIHEDVVKLSKVMEYESVVKEIITLVKKHNLQDADWFTLASNDSRYMYISSLANMAELDKPSFVESLVEKEGKEVVSNLFNRMDKCYDTELDYVLRLNNELTYMPNGFTQTPEGENYRNNHLLYVSPGNRSIMKEKMKAVKELFESKGSKMHYRVYNSGFGTDGEYYMVAVAAKDAEDYARKSKENTNKRIQRKHGHKIRSKTTFESHKKRREERR